MGGTRLVAHRLGAALASRGVAFAVLVFWLVAAALASTVLPSASRMESPNPATLPPAAQSAVAAAVERAAFGQGTTRVPGLLVLYRRGGLTPADGLAAQALLASLVRHPLVAQSGPVPLAGMPEGALLGTARAKGTTLLLPIAFSATGLSQNAAALETALSARLSTVLGGKPLATAVASGRLVVRLTGPAGVAVDAASAFKNADLTLIMATTLLILVLLVLIYRSPILPFVPLVGVGFAYAVASGVLGAMAKAGWIVLDAQTVSIMTVLMFGAGTDYTLFLVARYREGLAREAEPGTALRDAFGLSSVAIAMSAVTVVLALLCLLFAREGADHRFAVPYAVGVGMTALGSLTLIPAMLSLLGRRAFWPYTPRPERPAAKAASRPGAMARLAARRPWLVAASAVVLLGILASFAPGIRTTYDLLFALPASSQSRQGYDLLARAYGAGSLSPTTVLVTGGGSAVDIRAALLGAPDVASVAAAVHGAANGRPVAAYQVTLRQDPLSVAAAGAVPGLRRAAAAALRRAGVGTPSVLVAGATAQNRDAALLVARDTRVVIPLVLLVIAALLLLYLRSVVAAAYLIGTVVLSFFAALGLGWIVLHDLLGVGAWAGGVVLLAFVFLVALGEDYNIFMVSRIWQERARRPMSEAVVAGASATGPVITAAGVILAGTFAVLTALPISILLQFGVVTALGVLLDTLVVRSALVPALTALLGDRALWPRRAPAQAGEAAGVAEARV